MIKQYMTAMTDAQCRNQYACIEKKTATNKPTDKVTPADQYLQKLAVQSLTDLLFSFQR